MAPTRPTALPSASLPSREAALAAILLMVAIVAAFAPVLDAGFVFDDRADVLDNPAATPGGFVAALGTTNRPLVKASYALQRATTGDAARPFHALNLALHLGASLLVFAFARRLAAATGIPRNGFVAGLGAAVWALHPAAVEVVAPVSGRSVLLSSLAMLGALLLVTGDRPPERGRAAAAAALALAAALSRETALVLPALGLAWQATLGAGEERDTVLRRQLPLAGGALLGACALALSERHRELVAFSLATRAPLEALRGNLFALFEILRLAVEPGRISVDPASPAESSWSDPATLIRLLALAAAVGLFLLLRRRAPLAGFAIAWPLVALAPTNSLIWRLDPVSARPLYVASVAPILAAVVGAGIAWHRLGLGSGSARPRARPVLAATVLLALVVPALAAARSRERAHLYTDPVALWADAAAKSPRSARPWANLGIELLLADRLDEAEPALRHALALDPQDAGLQCALDSIHIRRRSLAVDEGRP